MKAERVRVDRRHPDSPATWLCERLPSWAETHATLLLSLFLLLTLLLGMIKLWIDPPSFAFNWENRWWQIALNVTRGEGYVSCKPIYFPFCSATNQVTAMREPLPVLLFAVIALMTKESLLAAAFASVIINLAIVVAVFHLARELVDTRTGLLAALLWAIYLAPLRLFYNQISGDLLATLGLVCSLFYFLRGRASARRLDWLAAGAWMGLAILSRSAVVIIALALTAALILWPHEDDSRVDNRSAVAARRGRIHHLRPAVLFMIVWAFMASPWLVRNYVAFGRPVMGSTLSGYYLYRQNHALTTDDYLRFVSGGEFVSVLEETLSRRPDLQGTENEAEMDEVYREEALQIIAAEPLRYVALSAYRSLMLWFNWSVNEVYGKRNSLVDNLIIGQHALLLGAGVIGIFDRWRRAWPLAMSVGVFSLLYMAVMAHLPYVVPVVPFLMVLSAITCVRLGAWLCRRLNKKVQDG